MKKIILISCSSKKNKFKTIARDLYNSPLFKLSLEYAEKLNPDYIFILSAEHHLVELDMVLEPYDTTLSIVSKKDRLKNPHLKVLSKNEKSIWGKKVLEQLSRIIDFKNDEIIILAGNEYFKPLSSKIDISSMILKGRIGERLQFLKNGILSN
jgi:hypothetical protein